MANKIDWLKDKKNNIIIPKTLTKAIQNEEGQSLDSILSNLPSGGGGSTSGDSSDSTVTFTEATTRENIATGEKHSTLFGKIAKWFADLKTIAFTGSLSDATGTLAVNKGGTGATNAATARTNLGITAANISAVPLAGSTGITGTLRTTGELQSTTPNGVRIAYGGVGFFIRNDANHTYFMLTNKNDAYGSYNDLRPMHISNTTGNITMSHAVAVGGGLSTSTLSVSGTSTLTGAVTAKSSMSVAGTLSVPNISCSNKVSGLSFSSGSSTLRLCSNSIATVTNDAVNTYVPIQASSFDSQSSEKVKENIVDITDEEASKILDVNVVSFDYKENFGGKKNNFGVIAEQVVNVIPSAVTIPEDYDESKFDESKGIMQPIPSVDYSKFVPHLIKMIQMQQREIEELKNAINSQ